jgi:predicted outer membrane repeat protein
VALLAALAFGGTARAANFTVNDAADAALANPASASCTSANGGSCTLRAAVQAADNLRGANTITLPPGVFRLSIPSVTKEDPSTGDLDVKAGAQLTISAAGAGTSVVDPNHLDRAFAVLKGASLSISGVTIKHGAQSLSGAGVKSVAPGEGGAIYNDGALSVDRSELVANTAAEGGGAIFSDQNATSTSVSNSIITRNATSAQGGALSVGAGSVELTADSASENVAETEGGFLWADDFTHTPESVTVTASTISHNVTQDEGGAVFLGDLGTATVTNSTFIENNSDSSEGGAIFDTRSRRLTVEGSSFSGNSGQDDDGGALSLRATDVTVMDSSFSANAGSVGGAILVDGTSAEAPQTFLRDSFSGNQASDEGGAIFDDFGALTVERSTFAQNSASATGGALLYASEDGLSLVNDTFDSNQAREGGAVALEASASKGSVSVLNDTIARNTAYVGGGISLPNRANRIENTIVADNTGVIEPISGGEDCEENAGAGGAKSDAGHNIDSDMTCFGGLGAPGDHAGVDALLAPLAENGGGLHTDALLSGSPAIAGANASDCPATDERGVPRPATRCDIGAYQTGMAPSITIASPLNGATFTQGQTVTASYSCSAPTGASVTECSGPVTSGATIETSALGAHTFTVNAADSEFVGASRAVTYTVVAATAAVAATPARAAGRAAVVPVVGGLNESARTWREPSGRAGRAKRLPVGTTFSFSLNVPASVTFRFTTALAGRRVGGKCVAQTQSNERQRTCKRTGAAGTLTLSGRAGTNKLRFQGLLSTRSKLAPGTYTALVTAAASGLRSATSELRFTISR